MCLLSHLYDQFVAINIEPSLIQGYHPITKHTTPHKQLPKQIALVLEPDELKILIHNTPELLKIMSQEVDDENAMGLRCCTLVK